VLVILPSQSCNRPFEERLLNELGSLVLRYNLPERYTELYDPANRWDSGHLSAEGARFFSRMLARDYAAQRGVPRDGIERRGEVPQ
jgi:lysophospholipase L1-like esterase